MDLFPSSPVRYLPRPSLHAGVASPWHPGASLFTARRLSSARPRTGTNLRLTCPLPRRALYCHTGQSSASDSDSDSAWEGALLYRRDASVEHLEYATTLERLGLGDLSSPDSHARAAAMGILLKADQKETPVLVSVDVTRRRGSLRLDGIVRTVITLGCFRCAEPAPQGIFSNFSLLLTEDPVEEPPDVIDLGTIYEEEEQEDSSQLEDDEDIDWDDRLHFPTGDKEIDISKHIRDLIHLEITFDAYCSPTCKGLCLACGTNLNTSTCTCSTKEKEAMEPNKDGIKPRGPLKELLRPLQQR